MCSKILLVGRFPSQHLLLNPYVFHLKNIFPMPEMCGWLCGCLPSRQTELAPRLSAGSPRCRLGGGVALLTPPADVCWALIWPVRGCRQPCSPLSSAEPKLSGARMSDLAAQQTPRSRGNGNPRVNSFFLLLCDHLEYLDP